MGSITRDGRRRRGAVVLLPLVTPRCRQGAGRAPAWDLRFGVLAQAPRLMARVCWRKCPQTSHLFSRSKARADEAALVQPRERGWQTPAIYLFTCEAAAQNLALPPSLPHAGAGHCAPKQRALRAPRLAWEPQTKILLCI